MKPWNKGLKGQGRARLSDDEVDDLRSLFDDGWDCKDIAVAYGFRLKKSGYRRRDGTYNLWAPPYFYTLVNRHIR